MERPASDLVKHREILFTQLHPDPRQAESASLLLADIDGVIYARADQPQLLRVGYDLILISLEQIEDGLTEMGFHLSSRLIYRMMRALYYYTEETERANLGCARGDLNSTRKVFADRYRRLDHHCRDLRPEHWRKYL